MTKNVARRLAWWVFGSVVKLGFYSAIVQVYARAIREMRADGKLVPVSSNQSDRPTILALSFENFRGDIDVLAARPEIRMLVLSHHWLTRLLYQFFPIDLDVGELRRYFDPDPDDPAYGYKQAYRAFLRSFLPRLYERLKIDAVVTHHYRFVPDGDWAAVSDQLGYPYVIFNRENMFAAKDTHFMITNKLEMIGKFEGHAIAVHNEVAKNLFENSDYVSSDKVFVLGCPRMDPLLSDIKAGRYSGDEGKVIVFFTFALTMHFEQDDLAQVFAEVHRTLLEIARDRSDVRVIMKVKPNFYGGWLDDLRAAVPEFDAEFANLPNLTITHSVPAHDLIKAARVLVAFNSTTLLEAAVTGRNLIVPYYGPLTKPAYDDKIYFRDKISHFRVPKDAADFRHLVLQGVEEPISGNPLDPVFANLFEEFISPLNGSATSKYVEFMLEAIEQRRNASRNLRPNATPTVEQSAKLQAG